MKKKVLILLAAAATFLMPMAVAQRSETYNPIPRHFPSKQRFVVEFAGGGSGGSLVYHGGPVLVTAYVIPIYWGPSWGTNGSDNKVSFSLTNFIDGLGTTTETGFGRMAHLRPPGQMSATPPRWTRGVVPLGTHRPSWSNPG